jgi:hypothetical protein
MRRALPLLALLASACAGATPTTCRLKYVERWNRPEKYQICMERWEIRRGRHAAAPAHAPVPAPAPVVITHPVAAPIITAFVDGAQRVCRLSPGGTYVCDPL